MQPEGLGNGDWTLLPPGKYQICGPTFPFPSLKSIQTLLLVCASHLQLGGLPDSSLQSPASNRRNSGAWGMVLSLASVVPHLHHAETQKLCLSLTY